MNEDFNPCEICECDPCDCFDGCEPPPPEKKEEKKKLTLNKILTHSYNNMKKG